MRFCVLPIYIKAQWPTDGKECITQDCRVFVLRVVIQHCVVYGWPERCTSALATGPAVHLAGNQ